MTFRRYVKIWLWVTALLGYEAFALNFHPAFSLLGLFKRFIPYLQDLSLSPEPGQAISWGYGWIGFGLILLTNPYLARKRWSILAKAGTLEGWLNFHIFCGLLGPTFILFHCNFKVRGLVGISFWSMVIVFVSGVLGRYVYTQVSQQLVELQKEAATREKSAQQARYADAALLRAQILKLAGAPSATGNAAISLSQAVWGSLLGDLRLRFQLPKITGKAPAPLVQSLKALAITRRRVAYLAPLQQVLGYWHSFHRPFAIFMYIVAVIHIAVALVMQVKH